MKRYSLLLTSMLLLLFTACKKDKQEPVNGISANKDNTTWNTTNVNTGFKPLATKDTLFITANNGEENIVMAIKQKGAGSYQPDEFKAYFYSTVGYDAIVSKYQLANNPANAITITDYDETAHIVKGTFNLYFKNTYKYNNSFPDEITFSSGKINAPLSDIFMDPLK